MKNIVELNQEEACIVSGGLFPSLAGMIGISLGIVFNNYFKAIYYGNDQILSLFVQTVVIKISHDLSMALATVLEYQYQEATKEKNAN